MRIRKHGGLVDVNKLGGVEITPFAGQSLVVNAPLSVTGAISNNGNVKQTVTVALTAAQIIAMGTTAVSLIAAPGAGKCVIVDNITLKMTTTATAFTGGGAVEFRYTDASGTKVTADVAAAVITAAAGVSFTNVRGIEASLTGTANAAVVVTSATAAFAAGTGSASLIIEYHVA
jgi:hypothetical protein